MIVSNSSQSTKVYTVLINGPIVSTTATYIVYLVWRNHALHSPIPQVGEGFNDNSVTLLHHNNN